MQRIKSYSVSLSIVIGFTILGVFIMLTFGNDSDVVDDSPEYRYDLIPANDNNLILFDKQTGEYWRKFIPNNEAPVNWGKESTPIKNSGK